MGDISFGASSDTAHDVDQLISTILRHCSREIAQLSGECSSEADQENADNTVLIFRAVRDQLTALRAEATNSSEVYNPEVVQHIQRLGACLEAGRHQDFSGLADTASTCFAGLLEGSSRRPEAAPYALG